VTAPSALALTYDECRARLGRAAARRGHRVERHPIAARGPFGQQLTVDVVAVGAARPRRALTVLSGVHGVEGFVTSQLQVELIDRLDAAALPDDVVVLVVHAVNPWGMAWGRRQNEANVDLNRNWRRSDSEPVHNDPYDRLHPIACPDTPTAPSTDDLLVQALALVEAHGLAWVRDAITLGQYRHPDGLHYGGEHTEESNRILEQVVASYLGGVERSLALDLHTGHGARGEVTFLSDRPEGSAQDRFLRQRFGADRVLATVENPDASTGAEHGQIAAGFADLLPGAEHLASAVEFGTVDDEEQLAATYLEMWLHRNVPVDERTPEHDAIRWRYRGCFTLEDPAWEQACLRHGADLLDAAVAAVVAWGE
jgi:predicted deacylase